MSKGITSTDYNQFKFLRFSQKSLLRYNVGKQIFSDYLVLIEEKKKIICLSIFINIAASVCLPFPPKDRILY